MYLGIRFTPDSKTRNMGGSWLYVIVTSVVVKPQKIIPIERAEI